MKAEIGTASPWWDYGDFETDDEIIFNGLSPPGVICHRRSRAGSQWQILDPIRKVLECAGISQDLQILDCPTNGYAELVSVNHAAE
jgi:hypothetical protein